MTRGPDEREQESEIESRRERIMATIIMVLSQLRWLRTCACIDKTQTPQDHTQFFGNPSKGGHQLGRLLRI